MRSFRFGVSVAAASTRAAWVARARGVEARGFDALQVPDHPVPQALPPLVSLAAAAEATAGLRLGTLVVNNDLRHPVVLAREAAAVDVLSDGRLELGLGAGHARPEYEEVGLRFDPPRTRVERLDEALAIVSALLAGEQVTVTGRHYRVTGHRAWPVPVQRPRPPLLVGGNGRALLTVAARRADIVGFTGTGRTKPDGQHHEPSGFPPGAVADRVALVQDAAGERAGDLELHALVQAVVVTLDRRAAAERLRHRLPELTTDEILATPYLLLGTADQLVEQLVAHREQFGFSYWTVFEGAMEAFTPVVERLRGG
jgi:probable F420-dependent oxidoreductase